MCTIFTSIPVKACTGILVLRSIEGAGMLGILWIVMHGSTHPDFAQNGSPEQRIADNIAFAVKWPPLPRAFR